MKNSSNITSAEMEPVAPAAGATAYYDDQCGLCTGWVRCFAPALERRGVSFVPMSTPAAAARLGLRPGEMPGEMKVVRPDGRLLGGRAAVAWLAREVWWLRALAVVSDWPGFRPLADATYRGVARNRRRLNCACTAGGRPHHHGATAFFEMP